MNQDELKAYFDSKKTLYVMITSIYVDFEDIEQPIKGLIKGVEGFRINPQLV